jgi:hypothetical protein
LCKRDRAESFHSALKALKVCAKYSIDFLHAELPVILWAQGEPTPLFQL